MSIGNTLVQAIVDPNEGGKAKYYALFNKANGVFYGLAGYHEPHGFNESYFQVEIIEIDTENEAVIGTYPDYTIELKVDQPQPIFEGYLNTLTSEAITQMYPVPKQLNNLAAAVLAIAEATGCKDNPAIQALQTQVDEIADLIRNNQLRKAGYSQNAAFDYITTEEAVVRENAKVEGGLHEFVGPRDVVVSTS